jgi:DNA-binding NarL/FixJ family response regulator
LAIDLETLPMPLAACLRTVRCGFPQARVLAFGRTLPVDDICRLLFLGIRGYVPYDRVEQDLGAAVQAVLNGHLWAAPEVLERYVTSSSALSNPRKLRPGAFTDRETAVIGLLQRRLCNKEIGSALGISERTVRFHLQNIFDKLGVRDRGSVAELTKPPRPPQQGPDRGTTPVRPDR